MRNWTNLGYWIPAVFPPLLLSRCIVLVQYSSGAPLLPVLVLLLMYFHLKQKCLFLEKYDGNSLDFLFSVSPASAWVIVMQQQSCFYFLLSCDPTCVLCTTAVVWMFLCSERAWMWFICNKNLSLSGRFIYNESVDMKRSD